MYLASLINKASGAIIDAIPVERFDDGVAHVLSSIGISDRYRVVAKKFGNLLSLVVYEDGCVIASVEDREIAQDVGQDDNAEAIIKACDALEQGDGAVMEALFKAA